MVKPHCSDCMLQGNPEDSYFSASHVDVIWLGEAPSAQSKLQSRTVRSLIARHEELGVESFGVMDVVRCRYWDPEKLTLENVGRFCRDALHRELEEHRCKVVVPFGAVALQALMPKGCITRDHGMLHRMNGWSVFPILHPQFVAAEPVRREAYENSFTALREVLHAS